jgi:hypothetical protein
MTGHHIGTSAWKLHWALRQLAEALVQIDRVDLAEELKEKVKFLWFYSLFADWPCLIALAGSQGVGKSGLLNNLLRLTPEEHFQVDECSVEHIPILILPRERTDHSGWIVATRKMRPVKPLPEGCIEHPTDYLRSTV